MNTSEEMAKKIYRIAKNGMTLECFAEVMNVSLNEAKGLIELCSLYDKDISLIMDNKDLVIQKQLSKIERKKIEKNSLKDLIHTEICVVSDTHFGNNRQQLHLLNKIYEEAYERGIKTVLHCGDMVDGNYPNRPENPRLQFLHNFDEQAGYVKEMYPYVEGITTKFILGSHDETHYKNGGATIGYWIPDKRKDMEYIGQDIGFVDINGIKICMDHPGGGSAKAISYKLQDRIEKLESGQKPKILLVGHYHKSYYFLYRNVHGFEVPCFCDKTQFQQKQGLSNIVGAYFLDIYSNKNGNIEYIVPEEILFDKKDMWDEAGKDKSKVKQLVIKKNKEV